MISLDQSRILLIGPIAPPPWGPATRNRIMIETLRSFGFEVVLCNTLVWKKNPFKFFFILFKSIWRNSQIIVSVSKKGRFFLIIVISIFRLLRPKRVVLFPAGGLFPDELDSLPKIIRLFYIRLLRQFDLIIVQAKKLCMRLESFSLTNVRFYPNFKPLPELKLIKDSNKKTKTKDCTQILFFSRVKPEKGIETLLTALIALAEEGWNFELHIFGILTSDYRNRFEELISVCDWVTYHGEIDIDSVVSTIAKFDLMVFPTLWIDEGFPGVLVDAAMAGLPVIASKIAYNEEIIHDGFNGLLVTPNDPIDLKAKIRFLLASPEHLEQFSKNNRKLSRDYDATQVLRSIMAELKSCGWL